MRWLQTFCPMTSSLIEMEIGELMTDRGDGIGVTGADQQCVEPTAPSGAR